MLELIGELSMIRMKRKDDPEVLHSTLTASKNKYEETVVSVDEMELVEALIAEAPKD